MNEYLEMSKTIARLADVIGNAEISLDSIGEGLVLDPIKKIYDKKYGPNSEYCDFFITLLKMGYKEGDKAFVVQALRYIAKDLEKNEVTELRYHTQRQQMYELFVEVGYYKNLIRNLQQVKTQKQERFQGRAVVYTAITGNYDFVKEPEYMSEGVDYILFTNNPEIKSDKWKVVFLENEEGLDNVRLARNIKIKGHEVLKDYDYSIWIDGKLKIKGDLLKYVAENKGENGILCFNHYFNNCIYEELEACKKLNKDDPRIMQAQIERYMKEGYPAQNGLIESGFLVRDLKDAQVKETMELWWQEVYSGSRRDQLSFNYACWKNKQYYDTTKLYIYNNSYVELYAHV